MIYHDAKTKSFESKHRMLNRTYANRSALVVCIDGEGFLVNSEIFRELSNDAKGAEFFSTGKIKIEEIHNST